VGARAGVWLGERWALTFRAWYFQTDAKLMSSTSPSALAFLGLSLEVLARWPLQDGWAVYGALGPAMAVATLDIERIMQERKTEEDSRSVAPGLSGAVGVEKRLWPWLSALGEVQGSLVYPYFSFTDRRMTPRLLNLYGLVGARVPF
jgi:hypothetical protein